MSAPQVPAPVYGQNEKHEYTPQQQAYPPQQETYAPQQPVMAQPQQQVIIQQVAAVTPLASLQQESRVVDCPVCNRQAATAVEYVSGTTTT